MKIYLLPIILLLQTPQIIASREAIIDVSLEIVNGTIYLSNNAVIKASIFYFLIASTLLIMAIILFNNKKIILKYFKRSFDKFI